MVKQAPREVEATIRAPGALCQKSASRDERRGCGCIYAVHNLGRGRLATVLQGNALAAVGARIAGAELISIESHDLRGQYMLGATIVSVEREGMGHT